jgi:hypothetical protein
VLLEKVAARLRLGKEVSSEDFLKEFVNTAMEVINMSERLEK